MEKSKTNLFVVSMDDSGQNVYTDESDPTKSYIFDDEGNLTDYSADGPIGGVKLERSHDFDDTSNSVMLEGGIGSLSEPTQLEMMNSLEEVGDFDDSLMPQLEADFAMYNECESEPEEDIIRQHMDIREPLTKLKRLLEQKLSRNLNGFIFCLQGTQLLEGHKNLVDQCIQGEGMVQINVQVQHDLKQINIIDVLKPAEDFVKCPTDEEPEKSPMKPDDTEEEESPEPKKNIVQWQVDANFKKEQERLKIPSDPAEWDILHVRHWVQWAVRQFNLPQLKLSDWSMDGAQLYQLTLTDFQKIVPNDPGDVFWTHLELLRQMKLVAIIKESTDDNVKRSSKLMKQSKVNRIIPNYSSAVRYFDSIGNLSNRTGNNGQIQLWQFLLELLTTRQYKTIIHWLGSDGEFKLSKPEIVAQLWGERKNKPTMNYEKLSRALRYYYDGDMISKVHGKRFVYKFVCDLKQLLGYSAVELSNLVNFGNPRRAEY